jgi:L-amino acid N-acyltransferase YncA
MPDYVIARATLADAAEVAEIYAPYVLHGTATFEMTPPDTAETGARMALVLEAGWPWLVARAGDGEVLGYAYAAQFRERAGYRFTCENSVYLREDQRGRGIGTALLEGLITAAGTCGFRQMIAGIAGSEPASVALHAKAGFREVARLRSAGRKHGQWLDVIYMQRELGAGDATPPLEEPA